MTEADWLACSDTTLMLEFLRDRGVSDRKLRLFAVACCRLFRDRLTEDDHHPDLLRDIFGNPFRPVTFDPSWRTGAVTALAERMSADWEFGAMPVLGDALRNTGCRDDDILSHCRGPGPHVCGCHVVDLVLLRS
jgi:hypothetical protein